MWQAIYVLGILICYITAILDGAAFLYMLEPEKSHLQLPFACLFINTGFFMLCSLSDAGEIHKGSHRFFDNVYQHDGVLYQRGSKCETCKHTKPARSKHCSKIHFVFQ